MKKKYSIALSISIIGYILAILGGLVWFREPILRAAGGVFALNTNVSQPTNTNGVISTSTLNYLSIGAGTTSITAFTGNTDQLDVNVFEVASSTLTDLRWRVEFSHSTTTVAADQIWFPEPAGLNELATTSVITRTSKEYSYVFASTTPHRIATSTAANGVFDQNITASFTFRIKDIAARWTRVIFYIPTGAATANDNRMDTLAESTALGTIPVATSTNAGIAVFITQKDPL